MSHRIPNLRQLLKRPATQPVIENKGGIMASTHWLRGAAAGLSLLTCCARAQAQGTTSALADLSTLLQPGQQIEVVNRDGAVVIGRLTRVSEASLIVDVGGKTVDLPASRVDQISRRGDPIKEGVIRGTAIGALSGLVPAVIFASQFTESDDIAAAPVMVVLFTSIGAGVGAALGAALDAIFQGKSMVFRAEAAGASVVPILGGHRKRLAVTLRF
jgi:hypothetical protein